MSRTNQLNQEFAFLPTQPPHAEGGIFELRTYLLQPGTLLEWENSWYVTPPLRTLFSLFYPDLQIIKGEEVSRPDVNLLLQWVHGSPKSGDFTKYIICGNIRERCPFSFFAMQLIRDFHTQKFTETKGYPGESVAERWMGRDRFEGKVSHVIYWNDVTELEFSRRRSWHSQWMLLFWRRCHSVLWNKIRIVCIQYCHPQIAKFYDVSCLFWIVWVIKGIGGNITRPMIQINFRFAKSECRRKSNILNRNLYL